MSLHNSHDLVYVSTMCSAEAKCQITDEGDVKVLTGYEVTDIDGDTYVYCKTCHDQVVGGEDGLADDWMVR